MGKNELKSLPFTFDPEDEGLLTFLRGSSIKYLGDTSRGLINKLKPGKYLSEQRKELGGLWSSLLTDALRGLKKHDTREWSKRSGIDFDSFFNEF